MMDLHTVDNEIFPQPQGELVMQLIAQPRDTNPEGDINGGWVLMHMDQAGEMLARNIAGGRVATVAVEGMSFVSPVKVGDQVSFYGEVEKTGQRSVTVSIEVWNKPFGKGSLHKVTDAQFVFVAIGGCGRTRALTA
ncbi:acyl-CoA thioesterase [Spongorhabdus nitratireducens]